jgi:hypothetical protein
MTVYQNKLFGAYFFATSEKTKMPEKTWTGAEGKATKSAKASYKAQLKSDCQRSG